MLNGGDNIRRSVDRCGGDDVCESVQSSKRACVSHSTKREVAGEQQAGTGQQTRQIEFPSQLSARGRENATRTGIGVLSGFTFGHCIVSQRCWYGRTG